MSIDHPEHKPHSKNFHNCHSTPYPQAKTLQAFSLLGAFPNFDFLKKHENVCLRLSLYIWFILPAAAQDRLRSTGAALEDFSKDAYVEAAPKVSAKKLERAAGVAQDLALKCRMAKARRHLLLRMAHDVGHEAFSKHIQRASVEVDHFESLQEAVKAIRFIRGAIETTTSFSCCASWASSSTLHLYVPSTDESAGKITAFIESGELESVIQATLEEVFGKKVNVEMKRLKTLKSGVLKTPVGLPGLGFQSHGLQGTVLNIDWVHPDQWAHAFDVKIDDLIIFINGRPTSELTTADVLQMSQTSGLQLLLARES